MSGQTSTEARRPISIMSACNDATARTTARTALPLQQRAGPPRSRFAVQALKCLQHKSGPLQSPGSGEPVQPAEVLLEPGALTVHTLGAHFFGLFCFAFGVLVNFGVRQFLMNYCELEVANVADDILSKLMSTSLES